MKITKNTVVSLTYDLQVSDAQHEKTFVEKADQANPLVFLFGAGGLIPAFENNVDGLTVGDKFEFEIPAAEAYGLADENAVVALPKDVFKVDGKVDTEMLQVGNVLPMSDEEGNRLNGRIVEVTDDQVIMDFNHPLAGKDLHFKGEVVGVREAAPEEISHGHVHHDGHHHH